MGRTPVSRRAPSLAIPSLEVHGHSWTAGFGTTDPKYAFPNRLAASLGGVPLTLTGQSGGMATGPSYYGGTAAIINATRNRPDVTAGPYSGVGGLKILLNGYNDEEVLGTGADPIAATEHGLLAAVGALRAARYLAPTNRTGTWAFYADPGGETNGWWTLPGQGTSGERGYWYCAVNGSYADYVLDAGYRSEAISLLFVMYNLTTAVATIRLNPAGANTLLGTYDQSEDYRALLNGVIDYTTHGMTGAFHIPKGTIPSGANTIRVTFNGFTGSNYGVSAGAIIQGDNPVVLPLMPPRAAYTGGPTGVAAASWNNQRSTNVAGTVHNAHTLDLGPYLTPNWNGSVDSALDEHMWFDADHPNNEGHAAITQALLDFLPRVVDSADVAAMSSPSTPASAVAPKDPVRVATTANITLSAPQTVDGVAVVAGDRVLVKDQTTGANNGIYVVAAGAWSRSTDADASTEVPSGTTVTVTEGTANGGATWQLTTPDPIVLGSTALTFSRQATSGRVGLQQDVQSHYFIAASTIAQYDAVIVSTTDGRVSTTTTANDNKVVGVALNGAASGAIVEVALAGSICQVNKTSTAIATRGTLVSTTTTAGKVASATAAHSAVLGKTLSTAAINTTTVWIVVTIS